jgi:hypothetical protein
VILPFDYVTNNPEYNLIMSVKNLPCNPKFLLVPTTGLGPMLKYANTQASMVKDFVPGWNGRYNRSPKVYQNEKVQKLIGQTSLLTTIYWSSSCGFYVILRYEAK